MRITLRTSKNADGSLSLYQAAQHFNALIKANGLIPAIRTTLSTARQLFFRDGGGLSFRGGQLESNDAPVIRGVPRRWALTVRHLIGINNYYQQNGFPVDHISPAVTRLRELIDHSGNRPDIARVTIVIPAFNNFYEVTTCIESIYSSTTKTNFKIIIADDASPDVSYSALGLLNGITLLRSGTNSGYIGNVNSATSSINTEYLLTLNQDVIVCPSWLDELVHEADENPKVGIVGPRILDQQFNILEAGGIIFQEAHAAHRGRGSLPEDDRYNFSCDVDYVSGCAMLVRTALWHRLGGLDTQYAPAYYDDVDICLRARKSGWLVRYAPLSCIVHFEGTSMGIDEHDSSSLKHFQVTNREKISQNHTELNGHTSIDHLPRVDSHCPKRTTVACVFESVPFADRDGGAVDFVLFVDYLLELGYTVSALFLRGVAPEDTANWRGRGVQCVQLETDHGLDIMENAHLIVSFGTMVGIRLAKEDLAHKRWIHHTSDCATRRLEAMNELFKTQKDVSPEASRWFLGLPRDVPQMWQIEKPILELPSITLFVTPHDLEYAQQHGANGNFVHFPILKGGPDSHSVPEPLQELTVGFVGSFLHSPNPDAVEYFLRDMWENIHQAVPGSRFLIWGSNINDKQIVQWSKISGVEVRGWFATWDEVVAQTRVLVSPLRFGAGMKHKVVSTYIYGRPVVGTCTSFEGFDIQHLGQNVMTDDPRLMTTSLIEILKSDSAWTDALRAGLLGMGDEFARSREIERVRNLVDGLLLQ
jgi:GT2 family glycosyltransferase